MTLLAVARAAVLAALWRVQPAEKDTPSAWRIIETRTVHVGLRPALANEGAGITLQVTVGTPW